MGAAAQSFSLLVMKGLFGFGKKNQQEKEIKENAKKITSLKAKWLVQYDRKTCIGSGTCEAVNPERWKVFDTKKAELRDAAFNEQSQMYELEIGDEELEKMKAAAEGCPPNCIHIINKETGEKII